MNRREYHKSNKIIEDAWMAYKKVVNADSLSYLDFTAGFNAGKAMMLDDLEPNYDLSKLVQVPKKD